MSNLFCRTCKESGLVASMSTSLFFTQSKGSQAKKSVLMPTHDGMTCSDCEYMQFGEKHIKLDRARRLVVCDLHLPVYLIH